MRPVAVDRTRVIDTDASTRRARSGSLASMMQIESVPPQRHLAPLPKLALELGPLVIFFLGNAYAERFGVAPDQKLFVATGVFIVATVLALAVHFALVRRLPIMPMVSGVVVVVFGGLTLYLQDKTFIMVKPTIVNTPVRAGAARRARLRQVPALGGARFGVRAHRGGLAEADLPLGPVLPGARGAQRGRSGGPRPRISG